MNDDTKYGVRVAGAGPGAVVWCTDYETAVRKAGEAYDSDVGKTGIGIEIVKLTTIAVYRRP